MTQQPSRDRPRMSAVDIACVVVILIAVAALVAWLVVDSGGGVLNDAVAGH
jgi:hypothetical protein